MRFWDSSAVVPLVVRQAATGRIRSLYRKDPGLVVWWGTPVECESALMRLQREGLLPQASAMRARDRLAALEQSWAEIEASARLREVARRFLRVHPLGAADALQLAAAFLASEERPPSLAVVCLDARLEGALRAEGFPLV